MSKVHSRYSASSMHRILKCPGSVELTDDLVWVDDGSTEESSEGDEAHAVLEHALRTGVVKTDNEEIRFAVNMFLDEVAEWRDAYESVHEVIIEERFTLSTLEDVGGTPDYVMRSEDAGGLSIIHIFDFKYGVGDPVSADDNKQLLTYATLLVDRFKNCNSMRVTIVQPRVHSGGDRITTAEVPFGTLHTHYRDMKRAMSQEHLSAGSHCQYCPVVLNGQCPVVDQIINDVIDEGKIKEVKGVIDDDTRDQWVRIWKARSIINKYLKRLDTLMVSQMQRGVDFEDCKPVQKFTNKHWIDNDKARIHIKKLMLSERKRIRGLIKATQEEIIDVQLDLELCRDDEIEALESRLEVLEMELKGLKSSLAEAKPTVEKLRTPTQLMDAGYADLIADFWEVKPSGIGVAKATDRRPAFDFTEDGVEADFAETTTQLSLFKD